MDGDSPESCQREMCFETEVSRLQSTLSQMMKANVMFKGRLELTQNDAMGGSPVILLV